MIKQPKKGETGTQAEDDDRLFDEIREAVRNILADPSDDAREDGIFHDHLTRLSAQKRTGKSFFPPPITRFRPLSANTARDVGEAIRLRRKDLRLTQRELAEKSGTRERFISEVERGKETAEIGKVLDLLDALGLETKISVRG